MSVEALRKRSREALHGHLSRLVYFYADPGVASYEAVTIRVHTKLGAIGDMKGTSLSYAEQPDQRERIIFLRSEVEAPPRGSLAIVSPEEGYWVDNVDPPDGLTVTATVTQATPAELAGREAPPEDLP